MECKAIIQNNYSAKDLSYHKMIVLYMSFKQVQSKLIITNFKRPAKCVCYRWGLLYPRNKTIFFKCGQPIVDHLFFDHLKSVFSQFSDSNLIFTILLDGFFTDFFTHIRLMIQMMPPPLSFFFFLFFSSFSDCYCTEFFQIYAMSGRVDFSFSTALSFFSRFTRREFLLSFSSALTFLRTFR